MTQFFRLPSLILWGKFNPEYPWETLKGGSILGLSLCLATVTVWLMCRRGKISLNSGLFEGGGERRQRPEDFLYWLTPYKRLQSKLINHFFHGEERLLGSQLGPAPYHMQCVYIYVYVATYVWNRYPSSASSARSRRKQAPGNQTRINKPPEYVMFMYWILGGWKAERLDTYMLSNNPRSRPRPKQNRVI
jgi:hypothetical protein